MNFASIGFGEFDKAAKAYDITFASSSTSSSARSNVKTLCTSSIDFCISTRSYSLQIGFASLSLHQSRLEDAMNSQAEAFYGEESDLTRVTPLR